MFLLTLQRKEIKKLIYIIKNEKEQIAQNLESMTQELDKYKNAYKKLVSDGKSKLLKILEEAIL